MDAAAVGERLSATKLSPPSTPVGVFTRSRLHELVGGGARSPLTMVVGPPGSGKTVLVSSWARSLDTPAAWLALDASDASPRRFWMGVTRALRRAGVEDLREPEPDSAGAGDAFVADVIDALADRDVPVTLVLDDFHEVGHAVVGQLDRLLEHPPRSLRLILISRRDPPLRLGRLRLAGNLAEIRARDLACTRDEAQALLTALGVELPAPAVTRLWARTEGWMAALVLAAISLRASEAPVALVDEFDGEDSTLSDYLMSEVLSRQQDDVQTFLLHTSILDVLEGDLVEAVTGTPGGHARLLQLAREGVLVTPIDRRGRWFRAHALFRDLLRAQLRWQQPAVVGALHARAAAWFAGRGDDTRAIHHAVEGGSWDLAADLAADRWVDLLLTGELDVLAPLLRTLPDDRIECDAALAVALAAVSLETEAPERAAIRLRAARAALAGAAEAPARTAAGLALVELLHARHTGERARALAATHELLRDRDVEASGVGPELRSLVLTYLGTAESWTGQVSEARDHLRQALVAAEQARSPWLRLQALAYLAGAESTCGDVPAARRRAEQALELARERGWTRTPATGAAAMVAALIATLQCRFGDAAVLVEIAEQAEFRPHDRPIRAAIALPKLVLLAAEGRYEDALDVVRAALAELGEWPLDTTVLTALRAWEARLLVSCGDRHGAERILDAAAGPGALLVLSTRARLMVDDGDCHGAREAIAAALTLDGPIFRSIVLDLWLVDALALEGLGDPAGAARSLEHALDLAAPGDLLRPIVSHGDAILPLLRRHWREGTRHRALVDRAIALIEGRRGVIPVSTAPYEPLSDRERQVLGYLPTIMSNGEIAGELFVSVNTVKTHMRSIYRKLGVENRRAAVARARELGLFGQR